MLLFQLLKIFYLTENVMCDGPNAGLNGLRIKASASNVILLQMLFLSP